MAATRARAVVATLSLLTALSLASDPPHPSAEEILASNVIAMGGEEAIRSQHSLVVYVDVDDRIQYMYEETAPGITHVVTYRKPPNKLLSVYTVDHHVYRTGFNGTVAWAQMDDRKPRILRGDQLEWVTRQADFYHLLDRAKLYKITYDHFEKTEGIPMHVLKFVSPWGTACYYHFDAGQFVIRQVDCPHQNGSGLASTYFFDYKSVQGVQMSFRQAVSLSSHHFLGSATPPQGYSVSLVTKVTVNQELDDAMFEVPPKK